MCSDVLNNYNPVRTGEQKTTWRHYIFIGIAFSSLMLTPSCSKKTISWTQRAEFNFINQTNYNITFPKGLEAYNIKPKASIVVIRGQDGGEEVTATSYYSPFDVDFIRKSIDDPLTIKFDNIKCLAITQNSEKSFFIITNYVAERIDKRTFKFTYTFTEADYNRAVTCP